MLAGMRLLATDLDGTLVFHHAVGQADAEALVRALAEVEGVISVDAVHASGLD